MDTETQRDLTKRLLDVYPNRFYNKIDETKHTPLYKALAYHAKEEGFTVVELVKKLGFERETFYDIRRMKEITENYDFIQNDFGPLFGVGRQAISLQFNKSENINYFWLTKTFTPKERNFIREKLIQLNKWEVTNEETGTTYRLISNFTKTNKPKGVRLALIIVNKEQGRVFFNELKDSEHWTDLLSNDYLNFSESVYKDLPNLKAKVKINLEPDGSINKNLKQELDMALKGSHLDTRLDLLRYLGFESVYDYKDKRFADEDRFSQIIEKYVTEEGFVRIPSRSADYAYLSNNAKRNDKSLKAFIESFGYHYISTRDTEMIQERIIKKLKKRNYQADYIYIDPIDPLYNSLARRAYANNESLHDFILDTYGYKQKKLSDIDESIRLYDWTQDIEILNKKELLELIEEAMIDGVLEIETYSSLYFEIYRYARSIKSTPTQIMKRWQINYKFHTSKEATSQIDEILDELEALNHSIEVSTSMTVKLSRNKRLVQKMKELYRYQCQICSEKDGVPPITMDNGKKYVEVHHITPLNSFHDASSVNDESAHIIDHYKNCLVVCPHHHKVIHYQDGGYKKLVKEADKIQLVSEMNDTLDIVHNYHL